MKLWKISQTVNRGYDTYDSAIVAAETASDAAAINPNGEAREGAVNGAFTGWTTHTWAAKVADVKVDYVGEAAPGTARGVILASFNAG